MTHPVGLHELIKGYLELRVCYIKKHRAKFFFGPRNSKNSSVGRPEGGLSLLNKTFSQLSCTLPPLSMHCFMLKLIGFQTLRTHSHPHINYRFFYFSLTSHLTFASRWSIILALHDLIAPSNHWNCARLAIFSTLTFNRRFFPISNLPFSNQISRSTVSFYVFLKRAVF